MAAAGRERRAERLNERLRGAQRINVDDESFNLSIDGLDQPTARLSSPARQSAKAPDRKRKRHVKDSPKALEDGEVVRRSAALASPPDPAEPPSVSRTHRFADAAKTTRPAGQNGTGAARPASPVSHQASQDADVLEAAVLPAVLQSPVRSRLSGVIIEEIEESPAHAPGSGQRRKLELGAPISSVATKLQGAVSTDATAPPSSPLALKARRSDALAATPSRRSVSRQPGSDEEDELSPDRRRVASADQELPRLRPVDEAVEPREAVGEHGEAEYSEEEAEEMDATEAAKALGKKRPRGGIRTSSPELGSGPLEAEQEEPQPRRFHRRAGKSPAVQRQPARKPPNPPSRSQRGPPPQDEGRQKRRATAGSKKPAASKRQDGEDDAVEITVQRFVNHKRRGRGGDAAAAADDDDDADPLQGEMLFANRAGESVVDVLAEVCEEVIAATLAQFQQLAGTAADGAAKKECRIKMRAIEAYREELRSRLLQHAIHLNHWHTLRRQVRQAQREKLALREEIIRLGQEREQVALRMDAVRAKHEADSRESTRRINTSALMHDIDLAVEQGRDAPELPPEAQRQADLANLELLIAQVSDEASSSSSTGGLLHQVKEFNAFLERAALALESR